MATKTLGTVSTTGLTAIQIPDLSGTTTVILAADIATIRNGIFDDQVGVDGGPFVPLGSQVLAQRIWPGAIDFQGAGTVLLSIPNRGVVKALPGDWIAIDPNTGWPILISANTLPSTLAATGTTANGSFAITFASSVLVLGWAVGMPISGVNVPAGSFIQSISQNGLTVTFSNAAKTAATGGAANTMTVSNFTHN